MPLRWCRPSAAAEWSRGQHVVQGVVQRAKIGIDLVVQRAGQEAEMLTGLDAGRVRMIRLTCLFCSA